jgi:hypothetical protein
MPRLTPRSLVAIALALTLLVGLACSSGDDAADDAETTTSEAGDTSTTTEPTPSTEDDDPASTTTGGEDADEDTDEDAAADSEDFPCDLVTTEQIDDLLSASLAVDEPRPTQNSRNDAAWTSVKCSWASESPEQEIDLDVARADGFASGEVECVEPMSDAQPIDPPAGVDEAYWTWDGLLVIAELQVCTPDAFVQIRLDTWDESDEAGAQDALLEIAGIVLAELEAT